MEYQLVLYDDNNTIIDVTKPITNVVVEGDCVSWASGRAEGIKTNFIIVGIDEPVGEPGEQLPQELIDKDNKPTLVSKEKNLQEQIKSINEAINFLLGL